MSVVKEKGIFITLEGGEGAGKSTQIRLLHDFLISSGKETLITREPGGSVGGEEIRKLLVSGDKNRWDPLTEALLFSAARRNHLQTLILPALNEGKWVISDRFVDSSTAYQGYGYGENAVAEDTLAFLYSIIAGDFAPDLTFILDIPPEEGLKRVAIRNEETSRFELQQMDFHKKMRAAYLDIANKNPERCVLINANDTVENVHNRILSIIKQRFLLSL